MSTNSQIITVLEAAQAYVDGHLEGHHLVRCVDDFVAHGHLYDCDHITRTLIDKFQDDLGLYVRDENTKREAPEVYYTDDTLKAKVIRFLEELTAMQNAKGGTRKAPGYNPNSALAIPNNALKELGINHNLVTGAQKSLYTAFAQTGKQLTWKAIEDIETHALVRGGATVAQASVTVQNAIQVLKNAGIAGPIRIPWGG